MVNSSELTFGIVTEGRAMLQLCNRGIKTNTDMYVRPLVMTIITNSKAVVLVVLVVVVVVVIVVAVVVYVRENQDLI